MANLKRVNSIVDRDFRNRINQLIDVVNSVGISIDELVVKGVLTTEQYSELITAINGLVKVGEIEIDTLSTELRNEIEKINIKVDKGNVSVADINKNLGKLDQTFLSDELLQQIAGTAPINAVPADESITLDKLAILKKSSNLFNEQTKTVGYFVSGNNGNLISSSSFQVSDYIKVKQNMDYTIKRIRHIAFYDNGKNFISGITDFSGNADNTTIRTPDNSRYMRFSWESNHSGTQQVNEGNEILNYEPFYEYIDTKYVERQKVASEDIIPRSIDYTKTDFIELGKNLFNKDNVEMGKYVNETNGKLASNNIYASTDFIEVEADEDYSVNYHYKTAFYDEYKEYISGISNYNESGTTFKTPQNVRYLRTTLTPAKLDSFQIEKGVEKTSYEPYGLKIPDLLKVFNESDKDDVLVFLPSEICVAIGRTIELYNKQVIWTGNIDNVHVQWESNIGKSFNRKWSFKGTERTIGEHNLTINVYDNNMNMIESKSTKVKVVDDNIPDTNLLTIGDSLTNGKSWLGEVRLLSNDKINNIGTRGTGINRHEGRSGVRASWYLNDSEYTFDSNYDESNPNTTGTENPFWNPTSKKFDFNYYKSTYNKNPDAVQLFLGTNGIKLDPTDNVNDIKTIVDGIRSSDSNIPIFVVFTLYRGNQDGIANQASNDGYSSFRSQWKLEEDRKVFNQMVALNEVLNSYSNLYFVPIALTHDSEYNFGWNEVNVNPRSTVKEYYPSESVHPQNAGYMQFADIMFSTIAAKV